MAGGGIEFHTDLWLARHWLRLRRRAGALSKGQVMMIKEADDQLLGRALAIVFFLGGATLLAWLA